MYELYIDGVLFPVTPGSLNIKICLLYTSKVNLPGVLSLSHTTFAPSSTGTVNFFFPLFTVIITLPEMCIRDSVRAVFVPIFQSKQTIIVTFL